MNHRTTPTSPLTASTSTVGSAPVTIITSSSAIVTPTIAATGPFQLLMRVTTVVPIADRRPSWTTSSASIAARRESSLIG